MIMHVIMYIGTMVGVYPMVYVRILTKSRGT